MGCNIRQWQHTLLVLANGQGTAYTETLVKLTSDGRQAGPLDSSLELIHYLVYLIYLHIAACAFSGRLDSTRIDWRDGHIWIQGFINI